VRAAVDSQWRYGRCSLVVVGGHRGPGERAEDGRGQLEARDGRRRATGRGAASRAGACRADRATAPSPRVTGFIMGVNATGTLGAGSQVERRRRENRGTVGGEGVGSGEALCPFPKNLGIFRPKMV